MLFLSTLLIAVHLFKQSFCAQADLTYEEKSGFLSDMYYHASSNTLLNSDFDSWINEWQITPEDLQHYFPEFFNQDHNSKELTDDTKKLIQEKIIADSRL